MNVIYNVMLIYGLAFVIGMVVFCYCLVPFYNHDYG